MVAEAVPAVQQPPALSIVGGVGPRLGADGRPLRAAGAIRVSEGHQAQGYSPATQRAAILARAHADGYVMDPEDIYEDHARGHKVGRKGYQAILRGVREGRYGAVYVFMLDRWGRDSIERQQRGKEFDRLGVPLVSVLEGKDEPGLIRAVRAELAEEESRKNAMRVVPNREKAARAGQHMGMTPYGFTRRYPEWDGTGQRPAGLLVPHEPETSVVRWLFASYASGQWSTRLLARDLNSRGVPGPGRPKEGRPAPPWSTGAVCKILRNPTYAGMVRFNHTPQGHYLHAAPGSVFVVEGKHQGLVEPTLFEAVQRRLGDGRSYQRTSTHTHQDGTPYQRVDRTIVRHSAERPYIAGFLRCQQCGGPMSANRGVAGSTRQGEVRCSNRHKGRGCPGMAYRLDLAEQALLAQVRRLRGAPWTSQADRALAGDQATAAQALEAALAEARQKLALASERILTIAEVTPQERAIFESVRTKLGTRIRELEHKKAQLQHDAQALPRLKALHQQLITAEIGTLLDRLLAVGDSVGLRDLLTAVVDHAVLVERWPAVRSTWLRFRVTWTADVDKLLAVGLLSLAPDAERPASAGPTTAG